MSHLDTTIKQMKKDNIIRVLLKPFMDVAGDHAQIDRYGRRRIKEQKVHFKQKWF